MFVTFILQILGLNTRILQAKRALTDSFQKLQTFILVSQIVF